MVTVNASPIQKCKKNCLVELYKHHRDASDTQQTSKRCFQQVHSPKKCLHKSFW